MERGKYAARVMNSKGAAQGGWASVRWEELEVRLEQEADLLSATLRCLDFISLGREIRFKSILKTRQNTP